MMPATFINEGNNVYRVELSGLLQKAEYDRCSDQLVASQPGGLKSARLLCILDGFEGWAESGDWNDITFYVRHGDALEKIAIVGDERWRSMSLLFVNADLRTGEVQFFLPSALAEARAWLSAGAKSAGTR